MPGPASARDKDKDKSAKWLIEHHGDAILRLGGVTDLDRWQSAPAELVLPAKLPDGLLFTWRAGRDRPDLHVLEIATYPESRAAEQALRDFQVFTRLRYKDPSLLTILGEGTVMIKVESPLIREIVGGVRQKDILKVLRTRFGAVPPELEAELKSILDETVLDATIELAASCSDLRSFEAELRAIPRPPEPWDPADEPEPTA
jgi:hypothetical protein